MKIKRHTQVSSLLQPDQRQKQNHNREPVGTTATVPIDERGWIDIEPSKQNLSSYEVSKKVIILLRHYQTVHREEGAIQFWRINFHFGNHSSQVQHWSDERWKSCLAAGGRSKRRYQYCSDKSKKSFTSVLFRDTQEIISLILRYRTIS